VPPHVFRPARGDATVGSWSFVLARPGLDDAVATAGRRPAQGRARRARHPKQLSETTAKNTLAHFRHRARCKPGVARYDKEIGLLP